MKTADRVFLATIAIVALTTAGLPYVRGYGTILFQWVVLGAWLVLEHLSSGPFADNHHGILYLIAFFLNLLGFSLIATPIWLFSRKRAPELGSVAIFGWTLLYVAMLFVLFPATDGP